MRSLGRANPITFFNCVGSERSGQGCFFSFGASPQAGNPIPKTTKAMTVILFTLPRVEFSEGVWQGLGSPCFSGEMLNLNQVGDPAWISSFGCLELHADRIDKALGWRQLIAVVSCLCPVFSHYYSSWLLRIHCRQLTRKVIRLLTRVTSSN